MLKEFKDIVYNRKKNENIQQIFDFGNLVDAVSLEGAIVTYEGYDTVILINEASGDVMKFTRQIYEQALEMRAAIHSDLFLRQVFEKMKFQYIFTRNSFEIEFEGMKFYLPMRGKLDGYEKNVISIDLKTTACTTRKACFESISFFDYDQQIALYMDLGRIDKFMIIFVSKKKDRYGKYQVFKFSITRGDETYKSGKSKYSYWAWKYYWMVHQLDSNLLTINI